jgi:hypothetical protein
MVSIKILIARTRRDFPPACIDLMYSMSDATPSSLMRPWKVGMMRSYPFTVFACAMRIDSRR